MKHYFLPRRERRKLYQVNRTELQLMRGESIFQTTEFRQAIAQAKANAYEIVGREHIKGDRYERVRHFCTCLRRWLGYNFDPATIHKMGITRPYVWFDAGVVDFKSVKYVQFNLSQLEIATVASSQYDSLYQKTEDQSILADLAELRKSLEADRECLKGMDRLSQQADEINKKWDEVEKEVEEFECS